ncbi:MAG: SurA N-terminal domain-containing protein [Azoarcus sp.]|jgi:peptidyl-prolyl cis-trans isomerase D|nr:SurA N-terminal domain-containing protein [Azoarcus sp.]
MFDAIRNNKRIAQVILAILIVPFAFFGLESYFSGVSGDTVVAQVGRSAIKRNEFDRTLSEEQERLRQAIGERATAGLLDSGELRQVVLDKLVTRRVLTLYASDARLRVSDEHLQQAIARIDVFQEDGQFSPVRYQTLLRQQGGPAAFEAAFMQDIFAGQLTGAIADASFAAVDSTRRLLAAQLEERVVREVRFPIAPHLSKIEIDEAAIQKYYDANPARFELPERVKAEYVALDEATLQAQVTIGEDEIRRTYEGSDYTRPEERRVRHILIEVASDADDVALARARDKAEELAATLRKNANRFPKLAKETSQDVGTKDIGGDIGFIVRGQMESAFDEAAFEAARDDIAGPVRTGYGFHILQVTDIRPGGEKRPLAEVREEIVDELRKQAGTRKFAEDSEKFSEMVFNQAPDSLNPAAEAFGLEIRHTDWIARGSDAVDEFRDGDLVAALFTDDAVKERHNTRAIEAGPGVLVSARVVEHEAARRVPLEEVRGQIEAQLRREEALRRVREKGAAVLASLKKGEAVRVDWSEARTYQRGGGGQAMLPSGDAIRAVFSAPVTKLPVWVETELPDDAYVIYQIDAVGHPALKDDDPRLSEANRYYERLLAQHDFEAFLTTLRARYKVKTNLPPRQAEAE